MLITKMLADAVLPVLLRDAAVRLGTALDGGSQPIPVTGRVQDIAEENATVATLAPASSYDGADWLTAATDRFRLVLTAFEDLASEDRFGAAVRDRHVSGAASAPAAQPAAWMLEHAAGAIEREARLGDPDALALRDAAAAFRSAAARRL